MKVAIVYDRVNKWGGAERVLLALHDLFPQAPLYTSVYNRSLAKWAKDFTVFPTFLQRVVPKQTTHEAFAALMPAAFESFTFDEYDLVISVSSEAAKGIITKPQTIHINICLTPTRYLWSGYQDYFHNSLLRIISKPLVTYLRKWDRMAANRPDHFIAISKTVQERIQNYYHRDSTVIYPPLTLTSSHKKKENNKNSYYLLVSRLSRLVPYKKVDLVIEAFNRSHRHLKIVGGGRDIGYFKGKSSKTIEFLGWLTDEKLSDYYRNCTALIFPGLEDFGLAMVEAQAHGAPVIAYKGGGALEIVQEGVTGEFFDQPTPESLLTTLKKFEQNRYNRSMCIKNAQRFSKKRFESEMKEYVHKITHQTV